MFIQILACVPVGVCLFWMVIYAIKCRDKKFFWFAESILLLFTVYLLFEVNAWIMVREKHPDTYRYAEILMPVGAIFLFLICYRAYRMTMDEKDPSSAEGQNPATEETVEEAPDEASEEYYETQLDDKPNRPVFEDDDLKAKFETLMIDEQLFLTQGITLTDIAARLNTNKTYLSRLVNTNYSMTFPEYLNSLRIDYAEQYILHHRDAKQIEIAEACGFPSASAFNNTFKKITGQTPKIWLATKK